MKLACRYDHLDTILAMNANELVFKDVLRLIHEYNGKGNGNDDETHHTKRMLNVAQTLMA